MVLSKSKIIVSSDSTKLNLFGKSWIVDRGRFKVELPTSNKKKATIYYGTILINIQRSGDHKYKLIGWYEN